MLEHLFGSKTRYKMLRLFFREPEKIFYVRELTRALDTQINAVRRELQVLMKADIVVETDLKEMTGVKANDRKKYYRLNTQAMIYAELQALLMKDVVVSEKTFLEHLEKKGGDIKLIVVSGIFTGDSNAPSDLFMVGDVKERTVTKLIANYEKEIGHPLRYTFMTEQEFFDRRHIMDRFVFSIFEAKHMKVLNQLEI